MDHSDYIQHKKVSFEPKQETPNDYDLKSIANNIPTFKRLCT